MASPFGLAYGIGAGLAGVPQAYMAGKDQAVQRSMRDLQMQNIQRQMAEEEKRRQDQAAIDKIMSEKIAPPMEQVPELGQMPRAMTPEGTPFTPAGTMQVPTGRTVEQPRQMSQNEQMAYELAQRAERLRGLGLGSSAFKLQQEAAKYSGMAQEEFGQDAARSIIAGSQDAPQKLSRLGFNVGNITRSGDKFILEDAGGNVSALDYNDLAALTAGKTNLASILQRIGSSENQAFAKQYAEEQKMRRLLLTEEGRMNRHAEALSLRDRLAKSKPGTVGTINAQIFQRFIDRNPDNPDAALQEYQDFQVGLRDYKSPREKAAAVVARMEPISDDRRERYLKAYEEIFKKESRPVQTGTESVPGRAGWKDSSGRLVYLKKGKYVYADGTEYQSPAE